ncbi:hypothetical protein CPC08DRAFT_709801 [Agrocybe pediades]|nr:hypothetical protein CPC08DRAFT_709801 [Agrocybe pediades]
MHHKWFPLGHAVSVAFASLLGGSSTSFPFHLLFPVSSPREGPPVLDFDSFFVSFLSLLRAFFFLFGRFCSSVC